MKDYLTLTKDTVTTKQTIEKSVFVAYAKGVNSADEAAAFVTEISKKNYDATHNCYAYVVFDKQKYSDDGEPSGTAGQPILECIKNSSLNCVCVVVTRYFGGVKLGTGGLSRAYAGSCQAVLQSAARVKMSACKKVRMEFDYSDYQSAQMLLRNKTEVVNTVFDASVLVTCFVKNDLLNEVKESLTEKSSGRVLIFEDEELFHAFKE